MATKELLPLPPPSSDVLRRVAADNHELTQSWDPALVEDIGYGLPGLPEVQQIVSDLPEGPQLNDYRLADPEDDAAWQAQRTAVATPRSPVSAYRPSSRKQNEAEQQHIAKARQRHWS